MIEYKRCSELEDELCYQGFKTGFIDYMIKVEMPQEAFVKRFFGPEGNGREFSFVALDDNRPIGVVLGGIRDFDGRRTLRCGAMCVAPEYRFRGVSVGLFERHRDTALQNHCQQLFLEVIMQNQPAVKFYKRIGYEKIYDINYFFTEDMEQVKIRGTNDAVREFHIEDITLEVLKDLRGTCTDVHINWQNEMEFITQLENQFGYGIKQRGQWVAGLSMNKSGQFHFLYVTPAARGKGMAGALLAHSANALNLEIVKTGFPNNASMVLFLKGIGFKRETISQYEMYLPL